MGEMTRHMADTGSYAPATYAPATYAPATYAPATYAPVTILLEEMPGGATRVAYDTVASAIAPYQDPAAAQVADRLDAGVLELLRPVTGPLPG